MQQEICIMKVINFVNMKGGVGKTTMAVKISDCLNREFKKQVLTLDIDPQFSATHKRILRVDFI